jgi:hypothetical protein
MAAQSKENHSRYVSGYHFILFAIVVLYTVGAVYYFAKCFINNSAHLLPTLILLSDVVFWFLFYYVRQFATTNQDRIIRAEENLRHFILTGKPLSPALQMKQVVALRFASDDEFVALCVRAVAEKLSGKEIKQEIKVLRADNERV